MSFSPTIIHQLKCFSHLEFSTYLNIYIPICSMVLEYLPTFTPKSTSFVGKYSSTMEHLGILVASTVCHSCCCGPGTISGPEKSEKLSTSAPLGSNSSNGPRCISRRPFERTERGNLLKNATASSKQWQIYWYIFIFPIVDCKSTGICPNISMDCNDSFSIPKYWQETCGFLTLLNWEW